MATALEALEQAKVESQTEPVTDQTKPETIHNPTVDTEKIMGELSAIDEAADKADIARLREQNRKLVLDGVSPALRPTVEGILEIRETAQRVDRDRAELNKEKLDIARERILGEYKEHGLTAEMLKYCPDAEAMKELAEQVKAVKTPTEDEKEPAIMGEKPASSATGTKVEPKSAEKYKRSGVERGVMGLLNDWQSGAE